MAVLFGGWNAAFLGDTWEYRGGHWSLVATPVHPSARAGSVLAYDPALGGVVLFGGTNGTFLGDTWVFRAGVWSSMALATAPPARSGAVATFDPALGELLLFGGSGPSALADTWVLSMSGWSSVGGSVHPAAVTYASMTYDSSDGYVLLFGGSAATVSTATWEFQQGTWTQLAPTQGPGARYASGLAYDPSDGISLLFGGRGSNLASIATTWQYVGGAWTQLVYTVHPSSRSGVSMTYDSADGTLLLFGGRGTVALGDTWSFKIRNHPPSWNFVNSVGGVFNREQGVTAYDPVDGYTVLFGGWNHSATNLSRQFLNDTWAYKSGQWTLLHPAVSPSERRGAMMVFDPVDGYLVMFGGSNYTAYLNDTWTFRGGVWTHLAEPLSPPTRRSAAIAFDETDGYVVLFGGHNGSGLLPSGSTFYYDRPDTWSFRGGLWTNITTPIHPSARAEPNMDYDGADGYVLLFGGYIPHKNGRGDIEQVDTWKFVGGVWTNLTASLPIHPSARDGEPVVFDPSHGYVLMFGGDAGAAAPNDAWAYRAGWTLLCTLCATGFRPGSHATYDASDGYVVYIGGNGASGGFGRGATFAWVAPVVAHASATLVTDVGIPATFGETVGGGIRPLHYFWIFGDGNTSIVAAPNESYPSAGVFLARLLVTDSTGVLANVTVSLTVHPTLRATVGPSSVTDVGHAVSFAPVVSGGTAPLTYQWHFGDGSTSNLAAPGHVYSTSGPYVASLLVTDHLGQTASGVEGVTVNAAPVPSIVASGNVTEVGLAVWLNGSANNGTGPFVFNWSFGDGTLASGSSVRHAYSVAGVVTVNLTVTDAFASQSTSSILLTVAPALRATGFFPAPGDAGSNLSFNVSAGGGVGPYGATWSFGDSAFAAGTNVSHVFAGPGTFNATVLATDALGAAVVVSGTVVVNPRPTAAIGGNTTLVHGLNTTFSAMVAGGTGALSIQWNFGDGNLSGSGNGTHSYAAAGNYSVQLVVTDSTGVQATATVNVVVTDVTGRRRGRP
jgi:PKD repeat protein